MTEIRFYHLQKQTLDQALPQIISKARQNGFRMLIKMADDTEVERMNAHLWTFSDTSFLPHGTAKDAKKYGIAPKTQPIWIMAQMTVSVSRETETNPNGANLLILTQGQTCEDVSAYELCCEMLDGRHPESVTQARKRWKKYQEQGHDVTYWHQNENGTWEQKGKSA